jgi:hypothetical protein
VSDPLRVVWDALATHGHEPHGQPSNFRARCPGHDGENSSALGVAEGADGRVMLHCFAHRCQCEQIVKAIGLSMVDLFPAGHHRARRRQLPPAKREELDGSARTVTNVLAALEQLRAPWTAEIRADCPFCGSPHANLVVPSRPEQKPFVHCEAGCSARMFIEALAGRVAP